MLNVNSIQDRLAGMSLPQLQQYAQLHKDDPYIVAMALHVSSMKRKMASAQQGQPTPPQPPVVEQAIAQMAPAPQQAPRAMLPEEQGIGALPERSLAKMAGGGIVAFEEGGEVERYAEGDLVGNKAFIDFLQKNGKTVRDFVNALPSEQAAMRAQFAGSTKPTAAPSATPTAAAALPEAATAMGAGQLFRAGLGAVGRSPVGAAFQHLFMTSPEEVAILKDAEQKRAIAAQSNPNITTPGQLQAMDLAQTAPGTSTAGEEYRNRAIEESAAADAGMYPQTRAGLTTPQVSPEMSALQALAANQQQPGAATKPGAGGIGALPKMSEFMPKETTDPFAKQREEVWAEEKKQRESDVAAFEQDIKAQGLFGLEREKRLKEREGKLNKREGENVGLALMNAGFAMMAGDSQYAMQNIGKGAQVGTKAYTEGQEKIDASREKLDDAFSRIDEIRRSEGIANAKELRGLKSLANRTAVDAKKDFLAGVEKAYGLDRKDANTMWTGAVNAKLKAYEVDAANARSANENQVRAQIALAQLQGQKEIAAMPGAQEKLFAALSDPNSDVSKGAQRYAKILGTDAKGVTTLLTKYTGMEGEMALQQMESGTPSQRQQAAVIRGLLRSALGGGFTNAPGGGTVHDITQ